MMEVIGVDLGGTKILSAKFENNELIDSYRLIIPSKGTELEILSTVIKSIEIHMSSSISAIGIGVPSIVDQVNGIVYDVQNIPSWKKVNLKEILQNHFNIPVFVNNDANCFALGESNFGLGKEQNDFIGISIGTGVAGGVIINNKLYNGSNSGAGEFGMLPYLDKNFEYYCSGQFFQNEFKIKGEDVYFDAKSGDSKALDMFNQFGSHLGEMIIHILYTYDPELIILGGSVSKGYSFFKTSLNSALESFVYKPSIDKLKIKVSVDPDIAVKGAAALCC